MRPIVILGSVFALISSCAPIQAPDGGVDSRPLNQRWRLLSMDPESKPELLDDASSQFRIYFENAEHFSITLDDGTKWAVALIYRGIVENWNPNDPLEITLHPWWPVDQFRIRNLVKLDHWENPQEIWGFTDGGLRDLAKFGREAELKITSLDKESSQVTLSNGKILILKDLSAELQNQTRIENDRYYLIAGSNPDWPYALLSLTTEREYTTIEARLLGD